MAERADLTDPLTPRNVQPRGLSGFGDPIFSDEFSRADWNNGKWLPWYPDTEFWNTTQPGGHKTNSFEPQGYDETGISMTGTAARLTFHESNHAVPELNYTSGMLCSYGAFSATYGVFEARMKLTNTQGSWPAFWMVQENQTWPPEFDIMENWGRPSYNTVTFHTYHYPKDRVGAPTGFSNVQHNVGVDVGNDYHTFTGVWEPTGLRWYVDGILAHELVTEFVPTNPMYMILNLAGDKDDPNAGSNAPFSIDIDYVRAWSLDGEYVEGGNPEPEPNPVEGHDLQLKDAQGNLYSTYMLRGDSLIPLTPRNYVAPTESNTVSQFVTDTV